MKTLVLVLTIAALVLPSMVEAEENGAEGEFMFCAPDSVFVWDAPRADGSQVERFSGFLSTNAKVYVLGSSVFLPIVFDPAYAVSILKDYSGKRVLLYAVFHHEENGKRMIDGLLVKVLPDHRAVGSPRECKLPTVKRPFSDEEWEKKKKYLKDERE